jgi:integrase
MSVRKRSWTTRKGEQKEAWIVHYADQDGKPHIKTYNRKKDADAYHAKVKVDIKAGMHTAPSRSITVAEAADRWLDHTKAEGRERTTLAQYDSHARLHIKPRMGNIKLASLTVQHVEAFRKGLLDGDEAHEWPKMTRATARKVMVSLKSILKLARYSHVSAGVSIGQDKRGHPLEQGRDYPTPAEIKRLIGSLPSLPACGHPSCAGCAGGTLI